MRHAWWALHQRIGHVALLKSCCTAVDLDLRVKPRDSEGSIRVALHDIRR